MVPLHQPIKKKSSPNLPALALHSVIVCPLVGSRLSREERLEIKGLVEEAVPINGVVVHFGYVAPCSSQKEGVGGALASVLADEAVGSR